MTIITVFGAGSIGCYLGGRARQGGARVRLIGRPRYRDAIAGHGLRLSRSGEAPVTLSDVEFATDPSALSGSDIVALCVKSQDTEEAARTIAAQAPDAWVVSFQNGVSNLPILREHVAKVSGAVVPFNVTAPEPGLFHQGTDGALVIGPDAPDELVGPLRKAGVSVEVTDAVEGHLWAKLLVNLNNALNALWGGSLRDGLVQRGYRRVLTAMIREGLRVAEAEGIDVATFNGRSPRALLKLMDKPDWLYRFLMDRIAKIDRTARSSMLDDLELGRANELEYLQGEIVRRAERTGLDVPVNRAVMAATQAAFSQKKSPRLNGAMMQARFL